MKKIECLICKEVIKENQPFYNFGGERTYHRSCFKEDIGPFE